MCKLYLKMNVAYYIKCEMELQFGEFLFAHASSTVLKFGKFDPLI